MRKIIIFRDDLFIPNCIITLLFNIGKTIIEANMCKIKLISSGHNFGSSNYFIDYKSNIC